MSDTGESAEKRRYELFFPRMLSLPVRIFLWLRGYFDARMGKVQLAEGKYVSSPYCKMLVDHADLRINAEWQECNGVMFELKPDLEKAIRVRDELQRQIEQLPELREHALADARIKRSGDAVVSKHLSQRRENRRESLVVQAFARQERSLQEERNRAEGCVSTLLAEYQDCRDIADTHERVVRIDYTARLSAYSRGASRRLRISSKFINDLALSTAPREQNDRFFLGCISGKIVDQKIEKTEISDSLA